MGKPVHILQTHDKAQSVSGENAGTTYHIAATKT